MLALGQGWIRNCEGVSRRHFLRVGGLGCLGVTLADALRAEAMPSAGRDRSCIFIWLEGGPPQHETFDPKPEAAVEIRGPYGAIESNVSGLRVSELLPTLARQMDKCTVIRTLTHNDGRHTAMRVMASNTRTPTGFGSVFTAAKGLGGNFPPYVRLGSTLRGLTSGALGPAYEPVHVQDPLAGKVTIPDYTPPAAVTAARFDRRRDLLGQVDQFRRDADADAAVQSRDASYQKAMSLLTSTAVRDAFDLTKESTALRGRYGANKFGQSCLLARRLIEAGSRFVEVKWFGDFGGSAYDAWDIHGADLPGLTRLEHQLCPRFDLAMAALLRDLHDRGLLESTLVVAIGEFGRTPRINELGGRDHWPQAQSILVAGAGTPAGTVIGGTDPDGAYPASRPVPLDDFLLTFLRILDLNPNVDDRLRPFAPPGELVDELLG